jgi:hypothetical protein
MSTARIDVETCYTREEPMATAPTTAPSFTGDQLQELLSLLQDSDTVELKVTVPDSALRSTAVALGIDPLDAQIRLVTFFDTPDLALNKAGVVVRARRIQGKGEDSIIKLRPVVPAELPAEMRRSASFNVEVDALPGGFVCSASMKGALRPNDVNRALAGELPLRKLFSKEQRAFYATHAPEGVALDDLSFLGPIFVLKFRFAPEDLGRRLVAEVWLYPDGSRILELSTRCGTTEAFQVAAESRAYLHGRGVDLSGEQVTKTRKALEFFSKGMKAGA